MHISADIEQPHDSHNNQISADDIVQKLGKNQNQNTGDKRQQRLKGNGYLHTFSFPDFLKI
jgi:hypothetical protein